MNSPLQSRVLGFCLFDIFFFFLKKPFMCFLETNAAKAIKLNVVSDVRVARGRTGMRFNSARALSDVGMNAALDGFTQ